MKIAVFIFLLFLIDGHQKKTNPEITVQELKETVSYLASDSLYGRRAGEKGDLMAADYIRKQFGNAGVKLLYKEGFQSFTFTGSAKIGSNNQLQVNGKSFDVRKDFMPYAFSANTTFEGPVVFAGFGLDINQKDLKWNDFENIDPKGKWLLVLQGDPDQENAHSPFIPYSGERAKALTASDKNAAGLILVAGTKFDEKDQLSSLFYDKNSSRYSIPVIQVTRAAVNEILSGTGKTIEILETEILQKKKNPGTESINHVKASVDVILEELKTQNVVALLPGNDPVFKNEYVVIGAHYDHLGTGGPASGSRVPDTVAVHNGADDNASGVAAMIELAEKLADAKTNKRSILFAAFGAEEMGLLGSRVLVADPPVETSNMVAMINLDMVGRLDPNKSLSIGGTKTAVETEEILNKVNTSFNLAFSGEGTGPSDHASFYIHNIPVVFISTGAHPDYHTPVDDADLINYEGLQQVSLYTEKLITEVANRNSRLTFTEAGEKFQRSRGTRFKVTLGVMPDYAGIEKRGMRIDAVTPGKPAEKGGMKAGDIVTAIEGKSVGNIYDYMNRLQTLEAGQTISVDVLRDEKKIVLIIQL